MSLPYRLKESNSGSGKAMAPIHIEKHHHRSTTKQSHKPFKPRFSSKGALKDAAKGKTESHQQARGKRHTPHQEVLSKMARRNQAKQLRVHHHEKREYESSIFRGKRGAPKHVALVPLSSEICVQRVVEQLNHSVGVAEEVPAHGLVRVQVDRFRRNLLYMPSKFSLLSALDVCRLADWVVFILCPDQQFGEEEDHFIRALEGQGITNVLCILQPTNESMPAPKKSKIVTQLKSEMSRYFPALDKLYMLDSQADSANAVRILCMSSPRGIRWRDERSWMLIEDVEWTASQSDGQTSTVKIKGVVRGKPLNSDRLVHLPGWGDFQMGGITETICEGNPSGLPVIELTKRKEHLPSDLQDELLDLAPEEVEMVDATDTVTVDQPKGVLLDDHHYFSDDNSHIPPPPRRLPKGTSSYQAAWFLDDVSDSGSDLIDDEDQDADLALDVEPGPASSEDRVLMADPMDVTTEAGASAYPESEGHTDRPADEEWEAFEEFRRSRKKEEAEDLEFPDEIELPPNVLARERLAKYRGLRNVRTSDWNTEADVPYEPPYYRRLLNIVDHRRSKKAAVRQGLAEGMLAGARVEVEIVNVPSFLERSSRPIAMFGLLQHEHKSTVVNLNLTLSSKLSEPIKSKEELTVQIGPRRFAVNPVFSAAGNTPNDVHKFDRFLHPGRTAIATFIGPLTWGSVPALVFKATPSLPDPKQNNTPSGSDTVQTNDLVAVHAASPELRLIGTATTVPVSPSRVIVKRVILTGHPYKIFKKLVTVRYMFFNKDDVAWFSALPLWTKRGRHGFIKESLGTHGQFKATFDGKINPMDAVAVSLYKRVWPRQARMWSDGFDCEDETAKPGHVPWEP